MGSFRFRFRSWSFVSLVLLLSVTAFATPPSALDLHPKEVIAVSVDSEVTQDRMLGVPSFFTSSTELSPVLASVTLVPVEAKKDGVLALRGDTETPLSMYIGKSSDEPLVVVKEEPSKKDYSSSAWKGISRYSTDPSNN